VVIEPTDIPTLMSAAAAHTKCERAQTAAKHIAAQTGCCHMDIPNADTLVSIAAGVSKADATPLPA